MLVPKPLPEGRFRLFRFRSPLLTESRFAFCSSGYLDVSVHRVRSCTLCIQMQVTIIGRVAPFGNPEIVASLPAPSGLSQVCASFVASQRQDIHRVPLVT